MDIRLEGLEEFENATLEDAWYELEGAYEVYGIGRCRFVLVHCRAAVLIGLVVLAARKRLSIPGVGTTDMIKKLDVPEQILGSLNAIIDAGRYGPALEKRSDEQEHAAAVLGKTLEVFEWIREKMNEK